MLEPMRSTFLSTTKLKPEPHANPPSPSRHQVHITEEIHKPDSRAFLRDPHWSRSDIYASMRNFRENSVTPEVSPYSFSKSSNQLSGIFAQAKLTMIHKQALKATQKAYETNKKLELVRFFHETHQSKDWRLVV